MTKFQNVRPLISVISPSLNQGEFMEDCVQSIMHQSIKNWEHIVIDGKSTDNSLTILKKYPHIRWISEKDSGYWEAITKGVKMARGKYIMICMISDGYVNKNWFKQCLDILKKNKDISLVWGLPQWLENGRLTDVCYGHFRKSKIPQKFDWFYYWLLTGEALPNGNFCVHKAIFKKCNSYPKDKVKGRELYNFNYNFNTNGYLAYHIPVVADFSRAHSGQIGEFWTRNGWLPKAAKRYNKQIFQYYFRIKNGEINHIFKDSFGVVIKKRIELPNFYFIRSIMLKLKIKMHWIYIRGPKKLKKLIKEHKNINKFCYLTL